MTGHGAAEAAAPNPRGRRAQLEMMQALQRRLNDIKSCDCPEDCRGEGRTPNPDQEGNNNNDDDDNDGGNNDNDDGNNDNDDGNNDNDDGDGDGRDSPKAPSEPPGDNSNGPGNNSGSNTNASGNNPLASLPGPPLPEGMPGMLTGPGTNTDNQNAGPAVEGTGSNTNVPGNTTGDNQPPKTPTPKTPTPKGPPPDPNRLDSGGGPRGDVLGPPRSTRFFPFGIGINPRSPFAVIGRALDLLGLSPRPRPRPPQVPDSPTPSGTRTNLIRPSQGNQSFLPAQDRVYLPGHVSRRAGARTRSKVLAKARGLKQVRLLNKETGKLHMSLHVHADPRDRLTRLGYYADLFLRLDQTVTKNVPLEREHIGYISTWRLSKEPNKYGHENHPPWVTEWLRSELGGPDDDARPFKDTLRLLYDENGQMRPVHAEAFQNDLGVPGSELVFVEMIWIKYRDEVTGYEFSHQRLASHALEMLYGLMNGGKLPAWFHINLPIIFIMKTGMPSDKTLSEMWPAKHPQAPDETDQEYCNRITDMLDVTFQTADRYGYIKISNDHRVLAHRVDSFPEVPRQYRIQDARLEDDTESTLVTGQPEPQPALSSMRC